MSDGFRDKNPPTTEERVAAFEKQMRSLFVFCFWLGLLLLLSVLLFGKYFWILPAFSGLSVLIQVLIKTVPPAPIRPSKRWK